MNSIKKLVWFSVNGVRRGALSAGLIALIWFAWAYGFTQGFSIASQVRSSVEMELKPIQINK
jgi:hypothetical protein